MTPDADLDLFVSKDALKSIVSSVISSLSLCILAFFKGIAGIHGNCPLPRSHNEGISRLWLFACIVGTPYRELSGRFTFPNAQVFTVRFCKRFDPWNPPISPNGNIVSFPNSPT
ncbi:hypothetical protein Gotri_027647 [Gossypium trilobum]|uniref:Uncharacterized protein n=1 Tax=Gossypium trilobum TaxID=34281 RepID=A0A7J9FHD3_9ROSI|nr:hypothetical protein [Gossypium trilobum]